MIPTDQAPLLELVTGILCFFTLLFHTWKWIKPKPILNEMLSRTYSWWAIFVIYLVCFLLFPKFGVWALAIISAGALHELLRQMDAQTAPKSLRILAYLSLILQFFMSSRASLTGVLAIYPVLFFVLSSVFVLLIETYDKIMVASASILWSLLISSFGLSHLALLLTLTPPVEATFTTSALLAYFLFLTQFNDVLQFIWGVLLGKHLIAPVISPKKTWEGLIGGVLTTTFLAMALRGVTPFSVQQSLLVGFLLGTTGYLGDLTLSAYKRSVQIKDLGTLIPGHGGILDRLDSVTLSALVYFYLVYFWFYT